MNGICRAVFRRFPNGTFCLSGDSSADGMDSAIGAGGENFGADADAESTSDACILINDCVHSDSPLVDCLAVPV